MQNRTKRAAAMLTAAALLPAVLLTGCYKGDGTEVRVRNWLELTFYARPRSKEFLLAFPALALFLEADRRRAPLLALPLGVLAELGAVSVINAFCHGFTPLRVSLIRAGLSAVLGLALGLVLLFLVRRLLPERREPAKPD